MDDSPILWGLTCRCGVDVGACTKGCTLLACCGGYITEGHMTDCLSRSNTLEVHGKTRNPRYTGPIGDAQAAQGAAT
jgi:hypothetical protein